MSEYHTSVLLHKSVDGLVINPGGTYIDVTFGGGGHSREILSRLSDDGHLIAFDQDCDALKNTIDDRRFLLINHNFRFLEHFLDYLRIKEVDGIIADLGVSSHQFDTDERGFSFRFDAPLDMRMNKNARYSADDVVNNYTAERLREIFEKYGEIGDSRKLVNAITGSRPIKTTFELRDACLTCLPFKLLPRVFQALRIEVNQELLSLETLLQVSGKRLKRDGRLSIISYHSLEDRMVKNTMRSDYFKAITRKAIVPNEAEINNNNRARSAKLRIGQRI